MREEGVRIAHPLAPLGQCSSRWRPRIGGPREAGRGEGGRGRGGQRDEREREEELLPAELCAAVAAIKAGRLGEAKTANNGRNRGPKRRRAIGGFWVLRTGDETGTR